jgi:short-subunit dehydrogenase
MSQKSSQESTRNPIALITGGSKGIGLELARQFAKNHHDLVLVARNENELQIVADTLQKKYECNVVTFCMDLTTNEAATELFRQLEAKGIRVDVLVNNAGTGDYGPFAQSDLDRQLDMLRINILTLTALTRLFVAGMLERGEGRILNVASLVAYFAGGAHWTSYVASKHYVLAFTRGLAKELSGTGVSVTALCPGPTETDFVENAGVGGSRAYRWLPKVSAANVAAAGYRGTIARRTTIVPGLVNKANAFLGELPPRGIAQAVFGFLSGGGDVRE